MPTREGEGHDHCHARLAYRILAQQDQGRGDQHGDDDGENGVQPGSKVEHRQWVLCLRGGVLCHFPQAVDRLADVCLRPCKER